MCVRACVRARARACVCMRARARACVCKNIIRTNMETLHKKTNYYSDSKRYFLKRFQQNIIINKLTLMTIFKCTLTTLTLSPKQLEFPNERVNDNETIEIGTRGSSRLLSVFHKRSCLFVCYFV